MLTRRYLGQTLLLAPRLHLQEGDERGHLSLDSLQANQPCELLLNFGERTRNSVHPWLDLFEPFGGRTKGPAELRPDQSKPRTEVVNRTAVYWHS